MLTSLQKKLPLMTIFIWLLIQIHMASSLLVGLGTRNTDALWRLLSLGQISNSTLILDKYIQLMPLRFFRFVFYGLDELFPLLYIWHITPAILWLCSMLFVVKALRQRNISNHQLFVILVMYFASSILFTFNPDHSIGIALLFVIPVFCILLFYERLELSTWLLCGILTLIGLTSHPLSVLSTPFIIAGLWTRKDLRSLKKILITCLVMLPAIYMFFRNQEISVAHAREVINNLQHLNHAFYPILMLFIPHFLISLLPTIRHGKKFIFVLSIVLSVIFFIWAIDQKNQDIWIFYSANIVGYIFVFMSVFTLIIAKEKPDFEVLESKWARLTSYFILMSLLIIQLFFIRTGSTWTDQLRLQLAKSDVPCVAKTFSDSGELHKLSDNGVSLTKKILLTNTTRSIQKIVLFEPNTCDQFLNTGKVKQNWGEETLAERQSFWDWDIINLR